MRWNTRSIGLVVLATTLGLVRAHALRFLALAVIVAVVQLASLVLLFAVSALGWVSTWNVAFLYFRTRDVLWPALLVVHLTAAASATLAVLRGGPFRLRSALASALLRAPRWLGLGTIAVSVYTTSIDALTLPTATALALVCLALPAAIEERAGPVRALSRAASASRDQRAPLAAALGILAIVAFGIAWVPVGISHAMPVTPGWIDLAAPAWAALFVPLPAIGASVAWAELRERREGRRLSLVFE